MSESDEVYTSPIGPGYYPLLGNGNPSFSTIYNGQGRGVFLNAKLLDQVRGFNFNPMVAAAEGVKTVNMVTSTIFQLTQSLIALKHGDVTAALRALGYQGAHRPVPVFQRDVFGNKYVFGSNTPFNAGFKPLYARDELTRKWLEIRYGWQPLLYDVWGAIDAYHKLTQPERVWRFKVSNSAFIKPGSINLSSSPANWSGFASGKATRSIIYEAAERLDAKRQLGMNNPATVVWELLPYSFVFDWFLPFGTYLDNLAAIPNLKGTFITSDHFIMAARATNLPKISNYAGASGKRTLITHNRSVTTSLPALSLPRPKFKPWLEALSGKHIIDAVALAAVRI